MFQDAFIKLEPDESNAALEEINPVLQGGRFNAETATLLGQDLSFYPGYRFLDIADYENVPHARKFVIYKPGDLVVLDWTNKPLYELNAKVPITLIEENVIEYLRFFFTYVRGPKGRFVIVESVEDIQWREEPPPAARKAIGRVMAPISIDKARSDGGFDITARMTFKESLFKAEIDVQKDGRVNLMREEILIEDMPLLDDTFGQ